MGEINSGIRAALANSKVYEGLQILFGANKGRGFFIDRYVRPGPDSRILDIGCGPASLLSYLPPHAEYVGYDLNPAYVATARKFRDGRAQFHNRRFTGDERSRQGQFDIVILSAVLHHLDDAEASSLFSLAALALKPGGCLVSIDCAFVDRQNRVARKLIEMDRGQNTRSPDGYAALARPFFSEVGGEVTNLARFPYTHWIMRCAMPVISQGSSASDSI